MRRCPPKTAHFVPQNGFFGRKRPQISLETAKRRQLVLHSTCASFAPCPRALSCPLAAGYPMSEKPPKNGQKWPKCAVFVPNKPKTRNGPYLGLGGSTTNSEGTYSSRNPPLFVVSKPQNPPTRRLDPCTSGHLVVLEGSAARAQWGPTGPPGRKKSFFPKLFLEHLFLLRFERVVARFGPWKIPKCLRNGSIWDQKGVKNGSKTHFSKSDPTPFGMLKQVILGHFEPVVTCFGPWKIPKWAVLGSKMGQKWVKNAFSQK